MVMLLPHRLKERDTIGLVAPSASASHIRQEVWQNGVKKLASKGFHVMEGDHIFCRHGHASGTVKERADDLNGMFADDDVDMVMSVYGGFNSHQLLEHLDYQAIASSGKTFIGFSDVTSLNTAILSQAGLLNFSGPAFVTFCQPDLPRYTENCFDQMLIEGRDHVEIIPSELWAEDPWYRKPDMGPREWMENPGWEVIKEGSADGRAIGGNLGTLMLLSSTDYWPVMDGAILFLEDDDEESPYTIDRHLTHLRHMGVFEQISGLVLGRTPSKVGFSHEDNLRMIVEEATRGYDLPILSGADFAHTDPLFTIPIGGSAVLDTRDPSLSFEGPFVR